MITNLKEFTNFINENNNETNVNLNNYDFNSLFNTINKECFNSELEMVPIKIVQSKTFTAQFGASYYHKTKIMKPEFIKFSNLFHITETKLKNIMCHEMIHYFIAMNYIEEAKTKHHGPQFHNNMRRINNLNIGYNITITDDEPGELNTANIKPTKELLFVYAKYNNKEIYILTNIKNYNKITLDKIIDNYKLSNVEILKTTSPHTIPLPKSNTLKIQGIKSQYSNLLQNIINDTKHNKSI